MVSDFHLGNCREQLICCLVWELLLSCLYLGEVSADLPMVGSLLSVKYYIIILVQTHLIYPTKKLSLHTINHKCPAPHPHIYMAVYDWW